MTTGLENVSFHSNLKEGRELRSVIYGDLEGMVGDMGLRLTRKRR